jgi:hypothetical protein
MGDNGNAIVESLPEKEAPREDVQHRILITFADNHGISGAKFDIQGVTPEQIAVASYHLMRSANQLSDAMMLQAARERGEVDRVMAELRKGKRS